VKLATLLIAVVSLCYSCGVGDPLPPAGLDVELYPYYERFLIDLAVRRLPVKHHIRSMRWTTEDLGSGVIGVCQTWENAVGPRVYTYRTVKISVGMAGSDKLGTLVHHELGHCLLGFSGHSPDDTDIMYWQIRFPLTDEAKDAMFDKYARGEDYEEE
jgi:hypothetical protein